MEHTSIRSKSRYVSMRSLLLLVGLVSAMSATWLVFYYHSYVPCEQTANSWTKSPYPAQITTQFNFGRVVFDNKTLWVGQSFSYGEALENIHGTLVFAVPSGAAFIVTYPGDYSTPLPITCRVFVKSDE